MCPTLCQGLSFLCPTWFCTSLSFLCPTWLVLHKLVFLVPDMVLHKLVFLWLEQNDSAHDSTCSAGKTILLSCMFCYTRANAQSCLFCGLQRNHKIRLCSWFLHVLQAKQLFVLHVLQIPEQMHNLVSFVACTEITRFDSAHDFCMFCRQTFFCPACSAIPEQIQPDNIQYEN
jgi:hypothetical protein